MKRMDRIIRTVSACAAAVVVVSCGAEKVEVPKPLTAEEQALADIVKMRRANFKDLGAGFKAIGDELKAGRASSTTVVFSIKSLNPYARDIDNWFPEGSGPELGVETDAKPEIWSEETDFAKAIEEFQSAVADLTASAEDPASVPIQFQKVGQTCKACHDQFREED